ncbi:hypothetical protein [Maledivibacter halophilus]|uniref:Uncharacterized protein n=1 Tax=Maledivibacter halophilus TaxID=36842 RepID=A0A1T5KYC6_9FIRM|nr:hypothetical protein [Maledivibacter halophilus]SKC68650.1 hypothetical protein SAMN02194393_02171 [Maledivibacter halophilus]
MKIVDNIILDFNFYFAGIFDDCVKKEVEFLECFLSENSQLVFMELECNLYPKLDSEITGVSEEIKKIVLENTILKTKEKLFDLYYETGEDEQFYWYAPKNKEEIIQVIEKDCDSYSCLVLKKGKELEDYDYLLDKVENLTFKDSITTTALIIHEKIENSFKIDIRPKIEKLIKY